MPKFAANVSRLWAELPYFDRFDAAAQGGFTGVAVPLPYEMPALETRHAALRAGLPIVHITAPPPNYTGGARGFAAVPGAEARFQYDLRRALRYCEALNVPILHVMAGAASGGEAHACLVKNLRYAVDQLPDGMILTVQPQANPDAYLNDFFRAAEVVGEVASDRLGLQFHSLHAHLLEGDAVAVLRRHAGIIRHVQIADGPDGGPPGSGDIDLMTLMSAVADTRAAWVVADYACDGRTDETLEWLAAMR